MSRLAGKVALVTGGAGGLGRASALRMARDGAVVGIADINMDGANAVVEAIKADGGKAIAVSCDILSEADIEAAVAKTAEAFGSLDVMFNNAAALPLDLLKSDQTILTISTEGWDQMMAGVLRPVMLGCRYAVLQMQKQPGGGSIINTSSMYGVSPFNLQPGYGTAKAGVTMLTQYVATAFGDDGIRCNAIAPSMIRTDLLESLIPEELVDINAGNTLTGKLGTPEDIANIVAFLASDDSSYLTGQLIRADGGTTAHLPTYSETKVFLAKQNPTA
ncbi:MAG: SDR family oxidoreductase [Novosphingobium sp.]|nr:SDR family oxidoreductase [Novosphingobium sp.]